MVLALSPKLSPLQTGEFYCPTSQGLVVPPFLFTIHEGFHVISVVIVRDIDSWTQRGPQTRNFTNWEILQNVYSSSSLLPLWATVKVKVTQSCLTLCDPMDYTVHGILQARILEWVAMPSSRGSSQPRDRTRVSHIAGGFFTSWATREAQEYWSG